MIITENKGDRGESMVSSIGCSNCFQIKLYFIDLSIQGY